MKKVNNYDNEWKLFIIVMPINTPESATYKKSYPEKKTKKNRGKYLRKYRKYYEGNKERIQKWLVLVDVRQKE